MGLLLVVGPQDKGATAALWSLVPHMGMIPYPAMAKAAVKSTSKTKRRRRWFTHTRMVTMETLLLIGVAQVWFKKWLIDINVLPGWVKIALLMLLMVGVLGFLLVYLEKATKKSLARANEVVQVVPLPMPVVLAHLAVIAGLFWLYGYVYGIQWLD